MDLDHRGERGRVIRDGIVIFLLPEHVSVIADILHADLRIDAKGAELKPRPVFDDILHLGPEGPIALTEKWNRNRQEQTQPPDPGE